MDADSDIGTPVSVGRKRPLGSGRAHSLVNRSATQASSSNGFKPGVSQSSFGAGSTSRSKPPIKGGGGAFKTQGEEELEDLENEEYNYLLSKMEMEEKLAEMMRKQKKADAKANRPAKSFLLDYLD